ncbi:MAG TPA: carboxymuconolactone decarboxylase family protein [Pseudonocardiaceae bacterium]|nr:carboxymuconolactone decarboxylase family protein [Pseudonocardiaceae bacterium]
MRARMNHPAMVVPQVMPTLLALSAAVTDTGLSRTTIELVNLRVSQLNGCAVCLRMHARDLRKAGEADERLDTVAGWRDAPYFTDAERAALDLAEATTRLGGSSDPVSDEVWAEAARHYDEVALGALVVAIAQINLWNRLNIATRQVAGTDGTDGT